MRILTLFLLFLTFIYANGTKEILLLHSYNKGLKWSDGISKGIDNVLKNYPQYELTTEYMDSKKIDTNEYFDALTNLYRKKFSKRTYDVIIAADNYALEFALTHHREIFNESNIVFCGLENFDKKDVPIYQQRFITGVIEYKEVEKNMKLIDSMLPDLQTLYIISDNSFSSLAIKEQILSSAKAYEEKFNVIYDNDISLRTLPKKIKTLPKNSAILFTSLYKDRFGEYIPYNTLKEFFKSSPFPIFALNKIHLGEGVLGGVMINPQDQGAMAAKKTIALLNGKSPLQIEVSRPSANYYFDRKVLDKFNITDSKLPLGANIINEPKDFFEKNRKLIDSVFVMLPLLVALIIFLVVTISRKISLEIELFEQHKLDNVLLNNIKGAIFWKSKDDILLGCNRSFCKMLGKEKSEIINKHISEVIPEVCQKVRAYAPSFTDEVETRLYQTASKPIDVLIRRQQYLDKNNQEAGVVTVISDITDIKRLELQRKKEEQFLIQRSKLSEIGEMMASIAHQWKNPLVEISSIAQELFYKRKRKEISKEDTQEFVNDIMGQVNYMTQTIDDFRSFIKPSTQKEEFSINKAIEELLSIINHTIKYNYIDLQLDFKGEKEFFTIGYPNEFKQSVLNIINNAKDSIIEKKNKHKDFQGQIKITVNQNGKTCIRVDDNGIGIPANQLENIFEPYISTKTKGDGFGLYMAKVIIEDKMGGKIVALPAKEGASILICMENIKGEEK